jgi:hypothetical protein
LQTSCTTFLLFQRLRCGVRSSNFDRNQCSRRHQLTFLKLSASETAMNPSIHDNVWTKIRKHAKIFPMKGPCRFVLMSTWYYNEAKIITIRWKLHLIQKWKPSNWHFTVYCTARVSKNASTSRALESFVMRIYGFIWSLTTRISIMEDGRMWDWQVVIQRLLRFYYTAPRYSIPVEVPYSTAH